MNTSTTEAVGDPGRRMTTTNDLVAAEVARADPATDALAEVGEADREAGGCAEVTSAPPC